MEDITKIYKALSDETRLRILNLLHDGDLCVCNITDALKMGQSKVSRHLAYLKNAGLVKAKRVGPWVYYSLSRENFYLPLLKCLKELRKDIKRLDVDSKRLSGSKKSLKC